jgi:hypothetical protein
MRGFDWLCVTFCDTVSESSSASSGDAPGEDGGACSWARVPQHHRPLNESRAQRRALLRPRKPLTDTRDDFPA